MKLKSLAERKARLARLDGVRIITMAQLRKGLVIEKANNIKMAGILNMKTLRYFLMFSYETYGHLHLLHEVGITDDDCPGWVRWDYYPINGNIEVHHSVVERGFHEDLPEEKRNYFEEYLRNNFVIPDEWEFNRYKNYFYDGSNWTVAKKFFDKESYVNTEDWQLIINKGLIASGIDVDSLEPLDPFWYLDEDGD